MDPLILRTLVVAVLLVATAGLGAWYRGRQGRVQPTAARPAVPTAVALPRFALDHPSTAPRALLLGGPQCGPCRVVERVLDDIARDRPGFRYASVDAAEHLDVVRAHRVRRVPTLLVLDAAGTVVARTSGIPDRDDLLDALDGAA